MLNLTEILQKELHDGDQSKGIVVGLLFDNLSRGCLLKTDGEILEVDKISPRWDGVKADARAWQNEQMTKDHDKAQFIREIALGQKIVDQNGLDLGEVDDVELTAKLAIKRVLISNGRYLSRGEVVAVGDVVIAKAKLYKRVVAEQLRRERVLEKLSESGRTTREDKNGEEETAREQTTTGNAESARETGEKANDLGVADGAVETSGATKAGDAAGTQENATAANATATQGGATTTQNSAQGPHANAPATTAEKTAPIVVMGDKSIRRRYGDFSFLIGKSVDKTVVNFQGEVMIRQHETITRDILRQAKISGKLLELYLHIE